MSYLNNMESIVFDLDGTLIDSVPDVAIALNKLLQSQKRKTFAIDEVRKMIGLGAADMIERAFKIRGLPIHNDKLKDAVNSYIKIYNENPIQDTVIYDGVLDTLQLFFNQGINMGICSNKAYRLVNTVTSKLNLKHFFSVLKGGDNVAHMKPDGRHIIETLKAMGANKNKSIMVGDSETDVAAADAAGIPIIMVTYGYCNNKKTIGNIVAKINSFAQLPHIINQLNSNTRHDK